MIELFRNSFVSRLGVLAGTIGLVGVAWAAPADRVQTPRPEPCVPFDTESEDDNAILIPAGLEYYEVKAALNEVIQVALYCGQPDGFSEVHLTFEMMVGCDGLVSEISAEDTGGAPEDYVTCVSDVIAKADFPAHQIEGGMPVTYPVNVAW
ncbi:MAG: hypothetical protein KC912_03060 [Proteobacteria bacterium]|nr:hypothetical protein [Pseudomonadota bacterium]